MILAVLPPESLEMVIAKRAARIMAASQWCGAKAFLKYTDAAQLAKPGDFTQNPTGPGCECKWDFSTVEASAGFVKP